MAKRRVCHVHLPHARDPGGWARESMALAPKHGAIRPATPKMNRVSFNDPETTVIAATRKKGVHDKAHGHPLLSIVYNVTDCTTKLYALDGKTTENSAKAGTAGAVPASSPRIRPRI